MNNEDSPPNPEKKVIIDKETTSRLREKWSKKGLTIPTQKKQSTQKKLRITRKLSIEKEPTQKQVPTTRKLSIKKELIGTTRKKLPIEKDSNSNRTLLLKNLQKPLKKEESELLRGYLENKEKCTLSQFKIDKNEFSKYMQDIYTLLCQNFGTYDAAVEYFEKYMYEEIVDKVASEDWDL